MYDIVTEKKPTINPYYNQYWFKSDGQVEVHVLKNTRVAFESRPTVILPPDIGDQDFLLVMALGCVTKECKESVVGTDIVLFDPDT